MRQPLTRQNSTRVKRRYSAYQKRIFVYLVTLVTAPLLLLGVLSSVVYYRQTVTRSDALLASARKNVEAQMEIALSNLRAYYSAVVSVDNYQTLCEKLCRRTVSTPLCAICKPPCAAVISWTNMSRGIPTSTCAMGGF